MSRFSFMSHLPVGLTTAVNDEAEAVIPRKTRRVLAILPYSPNRIRIRESQALRELIRHAEVDLVYLDDGGAVELPSEIRRRTVLPNASTVGRFFRVLLGILGGKPIAQEFYNSRQLPGLLAGLDLGEYDALYVGRLPVHRYLKHPRIIYDCQDCCSDVARLLARHSRGYLRLLYGLDALLLPRHERAACNAASVVLVTAEREVEKLRSLGVNTPVEVWTHPHELDTVPRTLCERQRFVVSFHGKLSYAANGLALRALTEVIAPALDQRRFELRVIGQGPARLRRQFPNLEFTGFVPSIMESIRDSDLSVFPLPVSTGFPNKAMESLAAGVPFIATANVVQGLPGLPEIREAGIYVREISEFAAETERYSQLSLPERQTISRRCYEYARQFYESSARQGQWERILGASPVAGPDRVLSR